MRKEIMKTIFVWLLLLGFALPASAGNWAKNLETAPGVGEPVPSSVKTGSFQYFMFIDSTDTTASDSSYIFIPSGFRVSVWMDDNLAAKTHGGNGIEVQMLWWPSTAIGAPPANDLKSIHLLGKTLNGVAGTGTTTDAIYDIDGPGYLKADITTQPGAADALVILGITERL
jgi:hypothetical protein